MSLIMSRRDYEEVHVGVLFTMIVMTSSLPEGAENDHLFSNAQTSSWLG